MATYKPFANLGRLLNEFTRDENSTLHRAALDGDEEQLMECIHNDNADINMENACGETALFLATKNCHTKIIAILLEHGACVNTEPNPLHVLRGLKSAKLLLNANGDINARDSQGYSPLQKAVLRNNMELVDFLIESGSDINSENSKGETLLHIVCSRLDITDSMPRKLLLQRLIEMGANIIKKNSMGKSPLHFACSDSDVNNLDIIRILMNSGASVSDQDINGWCPIHYFMEKIGSLADDDDDLGFKIIDLIMPTEEKANTTSRTGQTALHIAASEARENIISHLIRKGCSVNVVDGRRRNSLHYVVAHEKCLDVLRVLVEAGADVDSCDAWGKTVLHLAIEKKNTKLVNALVRTGADVNLGDIVGRRPIHAASEVGSREICDILVMNGADVDSLDLWLATPLHLAAWSNQPSTANFLIEAGCEISIEDSRGDNAISVAKFRSSKEVMGVICSKNSSIPQIIPTETKKFSKYENELLQLDRFQTIIQGCDTDLRSEPNVDKFLYSVLSEPTVGRGNDESEALEIQQAVEDFAQNIVKLLPIEDPKLRCTLLHAGSSSEGTKTRYPDEFDFMVCLEELSDSIYTEHEEADHAEGVSLLSTTASEGETLGERLEEGVNFERNVAYVSDYTSIHLKPESKYSFAEFMERETRLIPCCMMYYIFTQFISRILFHESFPKDPRLIIQDVSMDPGIQLRWRGSRYKMLDISVDFVPAVRLPCWPHKSRKNDKLLTRDILELPCLAVPKMPNSSGDDLWRCSMSLQETTIMRKCHQGIRNSYTLAKALVSSAICPLISFENYEVEKMLYQSQHSLSSDDDEFEIYESAEEIVSSYILKMAFLFSVQHKAELEGIDAVFDQQSCEEDCQSDSFNTDNVGSECQYTQKQYGRATRMYIFSQSDSIDAEIVSDIFRRCEEWLSSGFVPSFFNPRQNVLGSRMFEGDASKCLHFVKYIRKLLE